VSAARDFLAALRELITLIVEDVKDRVVAMTLREEAWRSLAATLPRRQASGGYRRAIDAELHRAGVQRIVGYTCLAALVADGATLAEALESLADAWTSGQSWRPYQGIITRVDPDK